MNTTTITPITPNLYKRAATEAADKLISELELCLSEARKIAAAVAALPDQAPDPNDADALRNAHLAFAAAGQTSYDAAALMEGPFKSAALLPFQIRNTMNEGVRVAEGAAGDLRRRQQAAQEKERQRLESEAEELAKARETRRLVKLADDADRGQKV